ncbi:MAG: class I tRNA ligase family protein [Phycisphaerales bacterium]
MSSQPSISDTPRNRYDARFANDIESRWQSTWLSNDVFRVPNPGDKDFDATRPKYYCLDMFPYPSGAGLHIGHPEGYTATDIVSRYKRMKGFNVLHPMGWDAFGLPAEQYAIQTGVHPAITTKKAIDNFRRQLQRFGFSYDWSREYGTIDPEYYKWTQWIFLQLYNAWFDESANERTSERASEGTCSPTVREGLGRARTITELEHEFVAAMRPIRFNPRADEVPESDRSKTFQNWPTLDAQLRRRILDSYRLAYQSTTTVNWCPKLGTVLANDEVIDGKSERGGYPVLRKPLKQWMFRITAYAERLLTQLDNLEWVESTKTMQREWIGKSEGAEIDFKIADTNTHTLRVFTTRPDTLFGATYMVVAPEHDLCARVLKGEANVDATTRDALRSYVNAAKNRSDVERQESKEKTGVFTGLYAINPATNQKIPIWTADYVLMGYGTGAIMAVPGHDERDWEFAIKQNIDIVQVVTRNKDETSKAPVVWIRHQINRRDAANLFGLHNEMIVRGESGDGKSFCGYSFDSMNAIWNVFRSHRSTLPIPANVAIGDDPIGGPITDEGYACNSSNSELSLNGLPTPEAKKKITDWLEQKQIGHRKINYKLRDWTFSRQRYWGEPFPIVFDDAGNTYPIEPSHLPVKLPELADYAPVESDDPQPLLAKAKDWVRTTAGAAGVSPALLDSETSVTRETNTMPGSAGSSWYAIRYCDAKNSQRLVGKEAEAYWMKNGIDLYLGGSEHAVGHLLYSRFWQNVLFDLGHVTCKEPFRKLFHQGLITSFAYQRPDKSIVPVDEVKEVVEGQPEKGYIEIATGQSVSPIITKMSKRYKNVINPDDVIAEFGADTCRLYEMYMGPLDASKPWNPRDIIGCFRFLQRAWRMCVDEESGKIKLADTANSQTEKLLHRLIKKVGDDVERLSFNTAIAAMIEFVNAAGGSPITRSQMERFILVLAPFAPHLAEEVWSKLGHAAGTRDGGVLAQPWPTFDPTMLVDDEIELPISVMGKVRARITVSTNVAKDPKALEAAAMADAKVQELIAGKEVKKVIVVPSKMINLVLG